VDSGTTLKTVTVTDLCHHVSFTLEMLSKCLCSQVSVEYMHTEYSITHFQDQSDCHHTRLNWSLVGRHAALVHDTVNQTENWHVCQTTMLIMDMLISAH